MGKKKADGHDSLSMAQIEMEQKLDEDTNTCSFSRALVYAKAGHKIARDGWNGKDMFVFLVPGSNFEVNRPPLLGIYEEGTPIEYRPHLDMRAADGTIVPWLASQADILANDWHVVD